MKDIHRFIYCHNIEISIQQLQFDANLFFVEVVSGKSPSHSIYHQIEFGAFLLRGRAGSPRSTAPALLVTFIQNRSTFSSPRITLRVSTASSTYTTFNCLPSWQKRRVLQISTQVVCVFQQWFAQYDPVQIADSVHLRRNAANSYLHHCIGLDRRLWRHPVSIEVPCSCW